MNHPDFQANGLPPVVRWTRELETNEDLDQWVYAARPLAERLTRSAGRRRLLEGQWLGHALHPLLTDLPLGAWMSATLLDLFGGRRARPAAARLVGFGVLVAVPTALTGVAEWAHVSRPGQRVGVVHAGANAAASVLYTFSWMSRRRGHHRTGAALGLAGVLSSTVGGYLGGHLALARRVPSRHPEFTESFDARESAAAN